MLRPFPADATTISISVTSASADTTLPAIGANSVRLVNEGPNNCYIAMGTGAQTAVVPSATASRKATPVLAGSDVVLSVPWSTALHMATICESAQTSLLRVSLGEGM